MIERLRSRITGVVTAIESTSGSIGLGRELMNEADISHGDVVQINNQRSGSSWKTYAFAVDEPRAIELHGAAGIGARVGDPVVVLTYQYTYGYGIEPSIVTQ